VRPLFLLKPKVLLSVLDVQLAKGCFGQFTSKEVINFVVMNRNLIHLLNAHDAVQAHPKLGILEAVAFFAEYLNSRP